MANDKDNPEEPTFEQEVIDDLDPIEETPVPPRIAPPKLGGASANPIHSVVSSDDVEFIGKVFAQVRHVDFRALAPEGNPRLTGIDKKLFGLREQVRKLERDLAHVAFVWGQKQQEIDTAAEWVRSKDEELIRATKHLEDTSDKLSVVEEELVNLRQDSTAAKEAHQSELSEQAEEVSNLKLQLLSMQEELDAEREDWAAKIDTAREDATKKVEQSAAENLRSQRAYDALKGLSQSEKEAHSLQQQTLRMQIAEIGERLTQSEIAELDAQRKNVELGALLSQKSAELEANSKSVSLLQTQVDALEASASADAAKASRQREASSQELREVQDELAALSDSTGCTDKELDVLKSTLEETQGLLSAACAERDEIQGKLGDLGKKHDADLQRQRAAHEQVRQQHQKDVLAIENLRSELNVELTELRAELDESRTQASDLQELSGKQTLKVRQVQKKLQDESELNRANLETIQMLQAKLRNANQSLNESESGFVELKARLATSESDKSALAQRLLDLEN